MSDTAMSPATVHNLRTEPMLPGDVYIGRSRHRHSGHVIETDDGYLGNPYVVGRDGARAEVIAKYEAYARGRVASDPWFRARVAALHGKRLFCYCAPLPCHGDVLSELAQEIQGDES